MHLQGGSSDDEADCFGGPDDGEVSFNAGIEGFPGVSQDDNISTYGGDNLVPEPQRVGDTQKSGPWRDGQEPFALFQRGMAASLHSVFGGNLFQVNKIEINYAKTAKKMDMKKLKTTMWSLLTNCQKDPEKLLKVGLVSHGISPYTSPCSSYSCRCPTSTFILSATSSP